MNVGIPSKPWATVEVKIKWGSVRRGCGVVAEQLSALGCTTRVR